MLSCMCDCCVLLFVGIVVVASPLSLLVCWLLVVVRWLLFFVWLLIVV